MTGPGVTTVLFDLDGTVSDSARGILGALRAAFADCGVPPLDPGTERTLLGPPFYESLPPLVGADVVPDVIARYREHYRTLKFDTDAYPGVPALLDDLVGRGLRLAVATSKPEYLAEPIVAHLGLTDRFVTVGGDTADGGRPTKADVVGHVLERLGTLDPSAVLMVGDRSHDVLGAGAHGIACLGAGWGYGAPGELEAAGALAVFATADELRAALDGVLAASRPGTVPRG